MDSPPAPKSPQSGMDSPPAQHPPKGSGSTDLPVYPFPFGPRCPRLQTNDASISVKGPQERPETHIFESSILSAELWRVFCEILSTQYNDIVNKPEKLAERRIPNYLVVAFVEAIEEAHQYFDLNKYLREEYQWTHVPEEYQWTQYNSSKFTHNDVLVEELRRMDTFNLLDKEAVRYALNEHIRILSGNEMQVRMLFEYLMFLVQGDFVKPVNIFSLIEYGFQDMFPCLNYTDMVEGFKWYTSGAYLFGPKDVEAYVESIRCRRTPCYRKLEEDLYVCLRRHYALVFRTREKGYVMDENPEVELQKDVLFDDWFFHARTVIVRNVSPDASEQDIKGLFSCADIEYVKMEQDIKKIFSCGGGVYVHMERCITQYTTLYSGDTTRTVHVIFKDLQATESALLMQGPEPAVLNLPVIIEPRVGSKQRQAVSAFLTSQAASSVHSVVEKAKFDEALHKYKLLRRRVSSSLP